MRVAVECGKSAAFERGVDSHGDADGNRSLAGTSVKRPSHRMGTEAGWCGGYGGGWGGGGCGGGDGRDGRKGGGRVSWGDAGAVRGRLGMGRR